MGTDRAKATGNRADGELKNPDEWGQGAMGGLV